MDFDLFKESVDFIYDSAVSSGATELEIVLMGGELHMLPEDVLIKYLNYSIDVQHQYMKNYSSSIYFSTVIITNLIGISDKKMDIYISAFKRFSDSPLANKNLGELALATSYEPDTGRFKNLNVLSSWKDNINKLVEANCSVSIAVTGTKGTIEMGADKLHHFLFTSMGIQYYFDYFATFGEGDDDLMPEYDELCTFLSDMILIKRNDLSYHENSVDGESYLVPYVLENLNSRWLLPLSVNFDGSISLDSESAADEHMDAINTQSLINVADDPLVRDQNLFNTAFKRLTTLNRDMLSQQCSSCRHVSYCQGGYVHYKNIFNNPGQCPGLYQVWDSVYPLSDNAILAGS
jgi:radical SAM protein with 4Fe4S-binding SPASM domain